MLLLKDGKIKIGEWIFRASAFEGLKVKVYGDVYQGRVSIQVVNGQVHVYGLLCTGELTRRDLKSLAVLVKALGSDCYYEVRFQNGKETFKKVSLK